MPCVVKKVQVVDREHDGDGGIERQILARLIRDVPEVVTVPPLERREERPVEAGKRLLPPRADLDLLDAIRPEMPDRVLRDGLRQEKHRIEGLIAKRQNALGQVPTEPAQPAIGMTQFLEVEHNPRPV